MKFDNNNAGFMAGFAVLGMMFGIPTICFYCFNGGWSDEVALGCIAIGAVLLGFSYFLYTALTYIVDEDGIRITRLGRTLYFLPWEQVKTIGIQKAYRGAFIVYVSRYDREGTKGLVKSLMRFGGRLDSGTHALNGAVESRWGRKEADRLPLLVLNSVSNMPEFRALQRMQIRSTNKTGAPPAETLIDFTYIQPWCG
jgi:hypothetical protein